MVRCRRNVLDPVSFQKLLELVWSELWSIIRHHLFGDSITCNQMSHDFNCLFGCCRLLLQATLNGTDGEWTDWTGTHSRIFPLLRCLHLDLSTKNEQWPSFEWCLSDWCEVNPTPCVGGSLGRWLLFPTTNIIFSNRQPGVVCPAGLAKTSEQRPTDLPWQADRT